MSNKRVSNNGVARHSSCGSDNNVTSKGVRGKYDPGIDELSKSLDDAFLVLDSDRRVQYATAKSCQIMGYSFDEIKGRPITELLDTNSGIRFDKQIEELPSVHNLYFDLNWTGTDSRNISLRVIPLFIDDATRSQSLIIVLVTSFANHDEPEYLRKGLPSTHGATIGRPLQASFIEQDGKIIALNGRLVEILGADTDEHAANQLLTLVQKSKSGSAQRIQFRKGNGDVIWIQYTCTPIEFAGGIARLGSLVDITGQKQLERRLSNAQLELIKLSYKLISVQEVERTRIANDLHDSVGQYLSALKLKIQQFIQFSTPQSGTKHFLEGLLPIIQTATDELRGCIVSLRPLQLDHLNLTEAIRCLTRKFELTYGSIEIETRLDTGEFLLGDNLDSVVYRIIQEALNNIAKHAKAKKVTICLKRTNRSLRLSIADDGIGFSLNELFTGAYRSSGMGLRVMKERIGLSKGRFSISTAPGSGTVIRAVWNNLPTLLAMESEAKASRPPEPYAG